MNTALITTGPAIAPIDDVRFITNFATGEIGTLLAETLVSTGWGVHLARGRGSTYPAPREGRDARSSEVASVQSCASRLREEPFTTNASVLDFFHRHATSSRIAIFHAAALCDFEISEISTGTSLSTLPQNSQNSQYSQYSQPPRKIPSTLDTLDLRLRPATKVLPLLRDLFPAAFIVGWKYEMDGTPDTAIERARAQIAACRTDACVVNGAAWGAGFGLVQRDTSEILPLPDKASLCQILAHLS